MKAIISRGSTSTSAGAGHTHWFIFSCCCLQQSKIDTVIWMMVARCWACGFNFINIKRCRTILNRMAAAAENHHKLWTAPTSFSFPWCVHLWNFQFHFFCTTFSTQYTYAWIILCILEQCESCAKWWWWFFVYCIICSVRFSQVEWKWCKLHLNG